MGLLDIEVFPGAGGDGGGGSSDAASIAAALAMTLGAHTVALQFLDSLANPVPFARFQVVGHGFAKAGQEGAAVISLDAGTYTVQATGGTSSVLFAPASITVTADGDNEFAITAESVAPQEPAPEAGTCIVYIDLLNYVGNEVGQLSIIQLPTSIGGRWVVGTNQKQTINTNGRIAFHPVPRGATVSINIPAAQITQRVTVPDQPTYALTENI